MIKVTLEEALAFTRAYLEHLKTRPKDLSERRVESEWGQVYYSLCDRVTLFEIACSGMVLSENWFRALADQFDSEELSDLVEAILAEQVQIFEEISGHQNSPK